MLFPCAKCADEAEEEAVDDFPSKIQYMGDFGTSQGSCLDFINLLQGTASFGARLRTSGRKKGPN